MPYTKPVSLLFDSARVQSEMIRHATLIMMLFIALPSGSSGKIWIWFWITYIALLLLLASRMCLVRRITFKELFDRYEIIIGASVLALAIMAFAQTAELPHFENGVLQAILIPDTIKPESISVDPSASLMAGCMLMSALALFIVVRIDHLINSSPLFWFVAATIAGAAYSSYGLFEYFAAINKTASLSQEIQHVVNASFRNRNHFAIFCGLGLIASFRFFCRAAIT